MKKAQSVGLIGTGSLTDSPLTRFWWLSERLGPVKSASYRVASRIANMLQAGHPVKDYAEFEACVLILVCVPDETVSQVVSEMLSSGISWRGQSRGAVQHLAGQRRAPRACPRAAPPSDPSAPSPASTTSAIWWRAIPSPFASRKRLVEYRERRVVAIERPLKPFYLAALTCTGTLLFALLRVASESLHHAANPAGSLGHIAGTATHSHASFVSERRPARLPRTTRTPPAIARALRGHSGTGALSSNRAPVSLLGS